MDGKKREQDKVHEQVTFLVIRGQRSAINWSLWLSYTKESEFLNENGREDRIGAL